MRKIFLILSLFVFVAITPAQNVLLHKEVNDSIIQKYGPNLRNFHHLFISMGFVMGEPDSSGSDILYGNSTNYLVGYRYKLKLSNWFAIGYDIDISSYYFRLKQSLTKCTPDSILHDKEKFIIGNVGGDLYLRFNYGRRGNRVGNFIDLGGYGDLKTAAKHFTKDKMLNGNVVEVNTSHLKYVNKYNYGAMARVGFNRYVIYGCYRLSDIFKDSQYPELPRITVGLQIGLHK
ncbi:MAG TPA: hypothetical protein PKK00_09175 [Bacteroidales bacterium]|nr:hypothetical protein [Bacteroidales bacterium]HPS17075.1 hypothetical protein [Bacteroidales bacterium]